MRSCAGEVFSPGKVPQSGISDVIHGAGIGERHRTLFVNGRSIPPCKCYGVFWVLLRRTVGTALLALLGMEASLQAQAGHDLASGLQERSAKQDLGKDYTLSPPDLGLRFDTPATWTAAALDGIVRSNGFSTETLALDPSPFFSSGYVKTPAFGLFSVHKYSPQSRDHHAEPKPSGNTPGADSKDQPLLDPATSKADDFNRDIYYKNKLEFSLQAGWLPINIPWPFDVFNGDAYDVTGVNYTLVPIIASLRWQMDDVGGPWIFRGNWDLTVSGCVTVIPRGPETRYFAYMMGIRRNFVRPRWRTVPFFNILLGLGEIDAKGPLGVYGAQGQNFTFTFNMGSGVRYNFSPRYAISAGINYMHISNFYLSEPKFLNYGINVYGPMVGVDVQLRQHRRGSE